jgi:putative FmdB family regulatory protein
VPTYDYQCRACGHRVEVIHAMTEPGPSACERCGGVLRRVLFPTGIIFKGSGFYRTDSRSAAKSTDSAGSGKAPKGGSDASDSAKGTAESATGGSGD